MMKIFFNHKNENCMAEITFEFKENFHWEFENKEGKISLVGWADAIIPNPENNNRIWKYKTASTTETIPYWKQKDPPTAIKGSVGHTKNIKADTIPDTVPKGVYPLENFSVGGWAPPTKQEVQQIITQNFDIVKNPICRILQSKNISHHLDIPQTPSLACDGQGFSMNSKLTYHHQVSIGASDETYDEEENYLTFHGFPIIEYAFQQKEKYIHPHNIVMMNNKHILFALGSNNNLKTHYFRMAEINDKGGCSHPLN
ncbi:hypothetical protein [Pelistega europaea]|uniref:Uncharacterized protein n=1 Tax=Pelistega europaea TaxID=106147 RepID=A0A7Y4L9Z3_9BURK|nr:hypothetical protein [Pelistega europaea]NOL48521.1 hypothetical protein [Pelistega europaea]